LRLSRQRRILSLVDGDADEKDTMRDLKSVKNAGQFRGISGAWLVVERDHPRADWVLVTDFETRAKALEFLRYARG
jgi:hypothetical protein